MRSVEVQAGDRESAPLYPQGGGAPRVARKGGKGSQASIMGPTVGGKADRVGRIPIALRRRSGL